ncbi:MAG: cytochrome C oxidase subunit IV family protein [Phycisphaeraceae bacterium]|nr:cytochrome C oxidase subunit IV family protein [Phycisphaeraceae bacterium]
MPHEDPGHHHIASFRSLFAVLVFLLIMTALTVFTAKYVHIGEIGNLVLALIIAVIKASFVCAIFMHLLHDKLLNSVVLLLCLSLVVCFIGFTAIDMTSRGALDPTREHFIGPPPVAEAEINAAIEKAAAEHGEHATEHAGEGFSEEFAPPDQPDKAAPEQTEHH